MSVIDFGGVSGAEAFGPAEGAPAPAEFQSALLTGSNPTDENGTDENGDGVIITDPSVPAPWPCDYDDGSNPACG
ncbi:hypothetical protein [Futiania mangrovi]|uniref:Uncharacterized protein n=1 Tax=Futiania mangrovi TaxID=2959716 RepID=A0A9J6PAE3_9PROT|nr:hypothetical protein [Futiania mangrovii]MCP1334990.1 hypothetical protein [Futiania mangrovii]